MQDDTREQDAGATYDDDAALEDLLASATASFSQLALAAEGLADQAGAVYEASESYVREYPGGVLLGAFAVGMLLGALLD